MKWLLLVPLLAWCVYLWRSAGSREVEAAIDPPESDVVAAYHDGYMQGRLDDDGPQDAA